MIADLSNWSDFKCSQLFDQISTNTKKVKTKECKEAGKYPVVDQGASVVAGYVDDETKLIELESPVCIFGDHTRAIKWIDFNFVPGADGTKVLKPKDFLNPRFFYYLLNSIYIEDKGYARHFKLLKSADVKVPSLDEQQRISDKLDLVLAKVEAAQARLDKIPTILKRFRQSVLAAATSGELTKDWREKNNDCVNSLTEFFITEYDGKKLGELPQGWGYVSFKDAADIKSNLIDPRLTPDAIHLAPNHIEANTGKILELVTVEQDGSVPNGLRQL